MNNPQNLDWSTVTKHHFNDSTLAIHFGIKNESGDLVQVRVSNEFLEDYAAHSGNIASDSKEILFENSLDKISDVIMRKYSANPEARLIVVSSSDI